MIGQTGFTAKLVTLEEWIHIKRIPTDSGWNRCHLIVSRSIKKVCLAINRRHAVTRVTSQTDQLG